MDQQPIIKIKDTEILRNVLRYKQGGYKLIQMCATKTPEGFELSYSFAIYGDFQTLRINIPEETVIPSITSIYEPAFLYENEMKDLFGVKIDHIAVDYDGNLYRTTIKTPFNVKNTEGGVQ